MFRLVRLSGQILKMGADVFKWGIFAYGAFNFKKSNFRGIIFFVL